MKKVLLSTLMCFALTAAAYAGSSVESNKTSKPVEKSSHLNKKELFTCAGEIYIMDSKGNKLKTVPFSEPEAYSHLDCLSRFAKAVAKVEAGLSAGQTTTGTVSFL